MKKKWWKSDGVFILCEFAIDLPVDGTFQYSIVIFFAVIITDQMF